MILDSPAGGGRQWSIRYRIANLRDGQTVSFLERGRFGSRVIGRVRRAQGTLRFRPADARGGARNVIAQTENDGLVTGSETIGRYRAPGRLAPGRVRGVQLRRRGSVVTARWRRAAPAAPSSVRFADSHGRAIVRVTRKRSLRVRGVARDASVRLTVGALARSGVTGRPARAKLRRARRPIAVYGRP